MCKKLHFYREWRIWKHVQRTHRMERQSPVQIDLYKTATSQMAPLISPTCTLPGRCTLSPRLGIPSESPVSPSSSTTLPPCLIIITRGWNRIHQADLLCSLPAHGPGLLVQLESLLCLRLFGVTSTCRSLLLRQDWCRLLGRRLRHAEPRAQKERGAVGAGGVVYPRSWTSNQVGKVNITLNVCRLIFLMQVCFSCWIASFTSCISSNLCLCTYANFA